MATQFCWEGDCVNYGILLLDGVQISQGRFRCSDLDSLLLNASFTFEETTPESLGLGRESEECSALNNFLFPPQFPPVIPPRLILDVKNNVTNRDIAPISVRFELIANKEIDRVSIVRTIWNFGNGSQPVITEGLFGSAPGFTQNHTYQEAIDFNGTITLQILDVNRNILDQETVNFNGIVLGSIEETFTPLSLILDVFPSSTEAPANVEIEVIGNQAISDVVVNWGDGSIPESIGLKAAHSYNTNGQFLIVVSATSVESQERISQTDLLTLQMPAAPPAADQIIFEVRKTIARNSLVAPASINYTLLLNPAFTIEDNKFRIIWTDFMEQNFDSGIRPGNSLTGKSQTFLFPDPGNFKIQVVVQQLDRNDNVIATESFSDDIQITQEEIEIEPPVIEVPIEEEIPVEIPEEIEFPPTFPTTPPEEEEIPIVITQKTKDRILLGVGLAAAAGVAIAATR